MKSRPDDLSRHFVLDVAANGVVTIREKTQKGRAANGGPLPVFSTNTREEAEAIQIRHCRRSYDRPPSYILNEIPQGLEDLMKVRDMFRETYEQNKALANMDAPEDE